MDIINNELLYFVLEIFNEYSDKFNNPIELYTALRFYKTEKYNDILTPQTENFLLDIKDVVKKNGLMINDKLTTKGINFYDDLLNSIEYIIES